MSDSVEIATLMTQLLAQHELEQLSDNQFSADPGPGTGRLFGGLVASQAIMAAGLTVVDRALHSVHAYFLRPGQHALPIRLDVDRIRDGRSFTTRRVIASQSGEAIFNLSASFANPETGLEHATTAPEAPDPETLPDWDQMRIGTSNLPHIGRLDAVEVRPCDAPEVLVNPKENRTQRLTWLRPRIAPPADPLLNAALLVYASDRTLLSTILRRHGILWDQHRGASLDHAVWLHRPPRFDDWFLYATDTPVAHAGRGLVQGTLYDRNGLLVASIAQEGLVRLID